MAPGDRGGGDRAGDPRHLLVRALHRAARRRGVRAALAPGEPLAAAAADRRDQDRGAAGAAITRQLAAILERRRADCLGEMVAADPAAEADPAGLRPCGWVFPSSTSASGHAEELFHLYARISQAAGTKFWFHGLRNAFISVAERELMLPRSLTKRLVNHARRSDVTEEYAADWTIRRLREPAQRIADRTEELMHAEVEEDPDWEADGAFGGAWEEG